MKKLWQWRFRALRAIWQRPIPSNKCHRCLGHLSGEPSYLLDMRRKRGHVWTLCGTCMYEDLGHFLAGYVLVSVYEAKKHGVLK